MKHATQTPPEITSAEPVPSPEFGSFRVVSNVPIPERLAGRPRTRYPWAELKKKGDSFFVPTKEEFKDASIEIRKFKNHRRQASILAAFRVQTRKRSYSITTSTSADGVRVWRTS